MTPQQWLVANLTPAIQANNPQATNAACSAYAAQLATVYLTYILPNLQVNLTTGAVTFVVPAGS